MKRLGNKTTIDSYNDIVKLNNDKLLQQLSQTFLSFLKKIDLDDMEYSSFVTGVRYMFRQSDKQMANPIHLTQLFVEGNTQLSNVFNDVLQQNGIESTHQYDDSDAPFLQKLMTYNFKEFQQIWEKVLQWCDEELSLPDNVTDKKNIFSIRDLEDIDDNVNDLHEDVKVKTYAGAYGRTCGFTIYNNHIYDSHHGSTHAYTRQTYDISDEDKDDDNSTNIIYGITMGGAGIISHTTFDEETTIKKVQEAYKKSDVHYKIYFQTPKGLLRIAKNKCHRQLLLNDDLCALYKHLHK